MKNHLVSLSKGLVLGLSLAVAGVSLFDSPSARAANTQVNIVNGQSDLGTTAAYSGGVMPSATNDVTFTSTVYNPSIFTLSETGSNLSIGTLDDLDASQAITIENNTASSTSTITLNGGGDSVAGSSSSDLLYVGSGGSLNIGGIGAAGTLGLALGVSGNFDIAGEAAISSIISGAFSMTKTGAGTLSLSGVNTFSGGLIISAGTVAASANTAFGGSGGTAGAITINGGTLETTAVAALINTHAITIGSSGGTISVLGTPLAGLTYGQNARMIFNTASDLIGTGALTISGTGALDPEGGTGVVVFNQANTGYTGAVTLQNGGMVEINNANAIGSGGTYALGNNSGLDVDNAITESNAITVSGANSVLSFAGAGTGIIGGSVTLTNSVTVGLRDWYNLQTVASGAISGAITGAGGLTVNSGGSTGGTLTLSNASAGDTYSGATVLSNASLTVNSGGVIVDSSSYSAINGTITLTYAAATNSAMLNSSGNVSLGYGGGLSLTGVNGSALNQSIGTLALTGGANTITVNPTGTAIATLNASGFSRASNATALVLGASLGKSSSATTAAQVTLNSTSGLAQVGSTTISGAGTTDATLGLEIVPYLFGGATGNGTDFLTYDSTYGLRLLTAAEQPTLNAGYATQANPDNAIAFNGTITTTSGVTLNSLLFNTATQTLNGSGGSLTVNSGAIAATANTEVIGSGFSGLTLGNGAWNEGVITTVSGDTLTINTPISVTGGGGLTKTGAGTVALGAANTYTGQTTINQGTLSAAINNVFNGTTGAALWVNNGGTASFGSTTQTISGLTLAGNATVSGASGTLSLGSGGITYLSADGIAAGGSTISVTTLDLNGTQTITVAATPDDWNSALYTNDGYKELTISSAVVNGSGTGGITKNGAGVLELSAAGSANTYSGPTTVNGGVLYLLNAGAGVPNSAITVNSGATLAAQLAGNATIGASLTLNGGNVAMGTNDNPNGAGGRANVYTFTGALKLASGASTISMNNTQNGGDGSNIDFGSLSRTAGATVLFRGSNLGSGVLLTNAGHDGIVFTTAPTLVGGGGGILTTTTSIIPYAIGDQGTYQNTFYLSAGLGTDFVTYGQNAASVELLQTYASTITSGASALNNVKITDASATGINAATTINSLILNSSLASLSNTGITSVDGNGALTINSGAVMVTTTSPASSNDGSNSNFGGLFQNNATIGVSGLTLAFGTTEAILTTVGSSTLTMASTSGGITGSGGLTKSGAGTLYLNAADTYTGTTIIDQGQIVVGNANALQDTTLSYNNQGGSLGFGSSTTAATLGGLSGAQNLSLTNASSAGVALTVGSLGTSTAYSGALGGAGSLIKTGAGTLTLSGASSYAGSTAVNGGTLALAGGSLAGTSGVSVNGATLALSGGGSITTTGGIAVTSGTVSLPNASSVSTATGASFNGGGSLFATGTTTITGPVTLAGGSSASTLGTIDLTQNSATTNVLNLPGGLTLGGASLGLLSNLSFLLTSSGSGADLINLGSGALAGNPGGAQINIGSTSLNSATYTLIDYGSVSGLTPGTNLVLGTHPSQLFTSFTLSLTSTTGAGALDLTVAGTPTPNLAYWTGIQGGSYNWGDYTMANDTTNWAVNLAGTTDAGQLPGANTDVVFAANNATGASLNTYLETNYSINSLTVLGTGTTATVAPVIGGTGALTLNAAASGPNSLGYSAGTGIVVNSGAAGLTINTTGGVAIAASQSWSNNSINLMSVSSAIGSTLSSGTAILTLGGTSTGAMAITSVIGNGSTGGVLSLATNETGGGLVTLSGINTYTGPTTITSGTLQIGNGTTDGDIAATSGITDNGTLNYDRLGSFTYGGVIGGSGAVMVTGTGTQVFTAADTYNGATTITGATLQLGNGVSDGTITATSAITDNGTLAFDWSAGHTMGTVISGTGALTVSGAGTVTLTAANSYTGPTTINSGASLQLGNGGATGSLSTSSALTDNGTLIIDRNNNVVQGTDFSGAALAGSGGFTQAGTGLTILNAANTYSGATTISSGTLQFNGSGAMSTTSALTIAGGATLSLASDSTATFTPASFTNPSGNGSYTIAVNGLTNAGNGQTITLANDTSSNTVGTITVSSTSSDTLAFNSSFQIGSNTTTINLSGANVVLNGLNNDNNNFDTLFVGSSTGNTLTINGQIYTRGNGNGSRWVTVQVNSGVLILNTTVSESGVTNAGLNINLSGGILDLQDNPGITAPSGSAGFVTLSSGTLNNISGSALTLTGNPGVALNGSFTFGTSASTGANNLNLGTGNITLGTSPTITLLGSGTLTMPGAIQSTANGFTEAGTGTLVLSGANLYTGPTSVTGGTLQAGVASVANTSGAFGNNSAVTLSNVAGVTLNITGFNTQIGSLSGGGTTGGNVTLGAATLTIGGSGISSTFAGAIGGTGGLTMAATGTQTLTGVNTYTGPTTISAGTLAIGGAGDLNSGSYAGNISDSGTFNYNSSLAQTLSGTISGGGAIIESGAGNLTLTSSNAYSGGTTISGGTLDFANGSLGTAGNITVNGGTLQWASGNTQDISSRLTLVNSGAATLDTQANNVTLGSGFGGSTSSSLTKIGSGTLALTGANTYTGGTIINAGTVQINSANGLGASTGNATINNGATLEVLGSNTISTTRNFSLSGTGTMQVDTASSYSLSGNIADGGSAGTLNKVGTGTLILNNTETYSGNTNVNNGTLIVSGALSGSGPVTVGSGATLGGGGAITGSAEIQAGGTLAPGAGLNVAGTSLTINTGIQLDVNSTLALNLDPSNNVTPIDFLESNSGGLSIGSNDTLTVDLLTAGTAGNTYEFALTNNAITGQFANVVLGGADAGLAGVVDYSQASGGVLTLDLVAVPEPGTWAMLICGFGILIFRRKSRHSRS